MSEDDFAAGVGRLLNQVGHWEQARWSAAARGDAVHALVQRLADLSADLEGDPHRPVPRHGDLALPDQLRVMTDDLLAAAPPAEILDRAAGDVAATRKLL